jgi:hydroxybutyrate-dimer hydrolase
VTRQRIDRARLVGEPLRRDCDGVRDDLLTAGLGAAGLRGPAPAFADPAAPTADELRRRAVHTAYRSLVDVSEAGGFGRYYGGAAVAGIEWQFLLDTSPGTQGVCLQIPAGFDPASPRVLLVASAGSRGAYGALPTAADWGLRHGYAVIHSDKGAGTGVWDESQGRGFCLDGTLAGREDPNAGFAPAPSEALTAFAREAPGSLLFKHAHGGANIEAEWGRYLLEALLAGLDLLSEECRTLRRGRFRPDNTLILAVGVSNGGAAVLRALERDLEGWIDGAVAIEPNATVAGRAQGLCIRQGAGAPVEAIGHEDYANRHFLYQTAALLAEEDASAPFFLKAQVLRAPLEVWCRELQALRVLPPGPVETAARAARERLITGGMLPEGLRLGFFNYSALLWPSITLSYAAAYARLQPHETVFGVRAAASDESGRPRLLTSADAARLWSEGAGIPPTAGVDLYVPDGNGRLIAENKGNARLAASLATDRLIEGADRAALLPGRDALMPRIEAGFREVVMQGLPGNRPVLLFAGRADGLIPVNHGSRAYYAVHRRERGDRDELRYYEVEHGQHFDGMLATPPFAEQYVPMQAWLGRAMERLEARLLEGTELAPSQVIRTKPRGPGAPPLTDDHLGALLASPTDAIRYEAGNLSVPA